MDNKNRILLVLLKDINKKYNANSISKVVGISSMGALKILKNLEKNEIVSSEKFGKASLYKLNFNNNYTLDCLEFILKTEIEKSSSYIKRWVNELKKITSAEIVLLFGSVLEKEDKANDIDVLFLVKSESFKKLKNEIEKLNQLNDKKIHPLYQTEEDFENNLAKRNKIILDAIKGIFVKGQKEFLDIMKRSK